MRCSLLAAEGNVCIFAVNCVVICSMCYNMHSKMYIYFMWYFRKLSYHLSGVMKVTITGCLYLERFVSGPGPLLHK